jgi:hypothetical protein
MNPGEFNEKISVLALTSTDNTYTWSRNADIFGKAERQNGSNIFSAVGLGEKSVKFTIRKRPLTLHNALRWGGKHCFLTDIVEINRMYYEVTAALIEPTIWIIQRTGEPTFNELNNPVYGDPITITFPACLAEKYIGHTQDDPMSTIDKRYVLVTPKIITLDEGEIVKYGDIPYEVLLGHTLDEYKNEYEISARSNA